MQQRTIDGELRYLTEKTRSRALRINDRGDGTGLDEQGARGATTATTIRFRDFLTVTFRYNHNVDAAMRKYDEISADSDNDTTQWRSRDA